jgi:hypothetical protein
MEHFLAYRGLYCAIGYVLLCSTFSRRKTALSGDTSPPGWLKVLTLLSVMGAAGITLMFRIIPEDSAMLAWECDAVHTFFSALRDHQSIGEFARNAFVQKPGLLSASAQTLMYGAPTYAILTSVGWSFAALRITSLIMGLASLALGAYIVKALFNKTAALLFVIVTATNPLFIFYMGYGVSQTATFFGLELALALVISALTDKSSWAYSKALAASVALFAANYNYAPARIFVVATIIFLVGFTLRHLRRKTSRQRAVTISVLIALVTTTLVLAEKRLNPYSDFASVRGEQAFLMARHKQEFINYLGDSPETRELKPDQLPLKTKIAFLWAIASARAKETLQLFSPLRSSDTYYLRGHVHGETLPPYQSALILPLIIGFVASIRSPNKFPTTFLVNLVFLGTLPLLLTNRVDNHRSFLMLIPLGAWMAYGLSLCLDRLRGGRLANTHCALVFGLVTAILFAHDIFFLATRDAVSTSTILVSQQLAEQFKPGVTIATPGMNCSQQATVDVRLASAARSRGSEIDRVLPPYASLDLTDDRFNTASQVYDVAIAALRGDSLVIASSLPLTLLSADLRSKGYTLRTQTIGTYTIVTASSNAGSNAASDSR